MIKDKEKKEITQYTIVGFNIVPLSINSFDPITNQTGAHCVKQKSKWKENFNKMHHYLSSNTTVYFSYDVMFHKSDIKWASRWDHYLKSGNDSIHWFSIITSIVIVMLFAIIVFNILCSSIKSDLEIINNAAFSDSAVDQTGWKQIRNEVFRKPYRPMLFSSLIGTGIQLGFMAFYTLIFAWVGFLSPQNRGSLLTVIILLFVFMGVFAGYYSGDKWLKNALLTAFLYPSLSFSVFFIINLFLWSEQSSAAVPFMTILAILLLWLCCSSPLVLIGAFIGAKKKKMKNPCKVNNLPYQIPDQPFYLNWKVSVIIAGVFPFWQDYRWWWKSFLVSGSSGLYIFAYGIYYYIVQLQFVRFTTIILYFGYMFLLSASVFLMTGTVGFLATYLFMKKIYSMIKID